MRRAAHDLGFAEKKFSACDNSAGGLCKPQYFSVVHFQLLCRDSEGTVSNVPVHLTPLTSGRVKWQLGGLAGDTRTDAQGFGQFTLVSERPTRGQRLILRIGKQFMGFTVSDVSKVVLPQNFCASSTAENLNPESFIMGGANFGVVRIHHITKMTL